jgi:hypothetical protein
LHDILVLGKGVNEELTVDVLDGDWHTRSTVLGCEPTVLEHAVMMLARGMLAHCWLVASKWRGPHPMPVPMIPKTLDRDNYTAGCKRQNGTLNVMTRVC